MFGRESTWYDNAINLMKYIGIILGVVASIASIFSFLYGITTEITFSVFLIFAVLLVIVAFSALIEKMNKPDSRRKVIKRL